MKGNSEWGSKKGSKYPYLMLIAVVFCDFQIQKVLKPDSSGLFTILLASR
jgi:hypothetical protein